MNNDLIRVVQKEFVQNVQMNVNVQSLLTVLLLKNRLALQCYRSTGTPATIECTVSENGLFSNV